MQAAYGSSHHSSSHQRIHHPSFVTQRVVSAKTHRVKQLQNQLTYAHFHLTELINENRLLRSLQKKHELALNKYESANADLPRVLGAHAEEMRVQVAKCKNLKQQNKDLTQKLKEKDTELLRLKDEHKHLSDLNKEKNLMEREHLQAELQEFKEKCKSQAQTIAMLQRRLTLEAKNYRHQLNREILKHKDTRNDLDVAITNTKKLTSILELKERMRGNVMVNHNSKSQPRKPDVRPLSKTRRTAKFKDVDQVSTTQERPLTARSHVPTINAKDIVQNKSATSLMNNKPTSELRGRIKTPENLEYAKLLREGMSDLDMLFKENLNFQQLPPNDVEELKTGLLKKIKAEEKQSRVSSGVKKDDGSSNKSRRGSGISNNDNGATESSTRKPEMNNYKDLVSEIENKAKAIDKHVEEYSNAKFDNDAILEQLKALDKMQQLVKDDNFIGLPQDALEELDNNFKSIVKNSIPRKLRTFVGKVPEIFGDGDMSNRDILNDLLRKGSN